MQTKKTRIRWIDNARGICVFCVLLAHCKLEHTYLQMIYTPFFWALFFFLSGYLFNCHKDIKTDILKLVRNLIIPYFLLCFLLVFIGLDNWKALLNGNYDIISNRILRIVYGYDLWFVSCIIMVQLYFILLHHIYMKNLKSKIATAIILLPSVYLIRNTVSYTCPYYCDIALFALAYFIVGNITKEFTDGKAIQISRKTGISLLILYICVDFALQLNTNMEFHFAYNYYNAPLLFIILSFIGIIAICAISYLYPCSFFEKQGKNSLAFFAFNGKALAITMLLFRHFDFLNGSQWIYPILLCTVQSFILLGISSLINKYAPFLVGKKRNTIKS